MNAVVPNYILTSKQKKGIISANKKLYRKATRKKKKLILGHFARILCKSF